MIYLVTFLMAIPSGVIWLLNAEALVAVQVADAEALPWLVALVTTLGQFVGYGLLYVFANVALSRSERVRRAVAKARVPADRRPGWGTYAMFGTGGLLGLPPLLALFAIYGSAGAGRLTWLIAAALPGRLIWYLGWAYGAGWVQGYFGWFVDP